MRRVFGVDQIFATAALAVLIALVLYDSRYHFDSEHIEIKHKHHSAQRNWNVHYGQRYVYSDSSFRYQADFDHLRDFIEPGSLLLADLATSYYAATMLPVYVANVHPHHRRWERPDWQNFLDKRLSCYLEFEENRQELETFLSTHRELDYFLVNSDPLNNNLKRDCLGFRSRTLFRELPRFARLVWKGEHLTLYRID